MGKTIYSFELRLDAVLRHLDGVPLKVLAEEIHCSAGDILRRSYAAETHIVQVQVNNADRGEDP